MSAWSRHIELRQESGETKAYRTSDGREIPIPNSPREGVNMKEWMDNMSLDALEAFLQALWDRWTWDTGTDSDVALAKRVELEIDKRATQVGLSPHQKAMAQQQGRVTFDATHIRQMQDPRNG